MNDRAKYYRELCTKAAERLGVEPTDERAEHIATLQMAREAISAKLIEGRDIDPNALLKINEALHTILPPVKPPRVEIEIIEGNFQHCPACGHTAPREEPPAQGTLPPAPARAADPLARPIEATPAPKPRADKVVLLKKDYEPAHDFHNGAPVKQDVGPRDPFLGAFIGTGHDYSFPDAYKPRSGFPGA